MRPSYNLHFASPFRNLLLSQLHTVPVCDDLCIDRAGQESVSIKHISETYIVKSYYDVKRTNDPYIQKIQEGSRGKNTLPIKSWIMGYQSISQRTSQPSLLCSRHHYVLAKEAARSFNEIGRCSVCMLGNVSCSLGVRRYLSSKSRHVGFLVPINLINLKIVQGTDW